VSDELGRLHGGEASGVLRRHGAREGSVIGRHLGREIGRGGRSDGGRGGGAELLEGADSLQGTGQGEVPVSLSTSCFCVPGHPQAAALRCTFMPREARLGGHSEQEQDDGERARASRKSPSVLRARRLPNSMEVANFQGADLELLRRSVSVRKTTLCWLPHSPNMQNCRPNRSPLFYL